MKDGFKETEQKVIHLNELHKVDRETAIILGLRLREKPKVVKSKKKIWKDEQTKSIWKV